MTIEISVIYCTNKLGGIELMANTLMKQNFNLNNVEAIIVDDFYELRKDAVNEYLTGVPFQWKHFGPRSKNKVNLASKFNDALVKAEGELIVSLEDYEWAEPDWLTSHYDTWKSAPKGNIIMNGRTHNCLWPDNTKVPGPVQLDNKFMVDPSNLLISVFDGPIGMTILDYDYRYENNGISPGDILPRMSTHIYRNVSAPLSGLIEINGYDEKFDHSEPGIFLNCPSADLYFRLECIGYRFKYVPTGALYHVNHYDYFKWNRVANYTYFRTKIKRIRNLEEGPLAASNFHELRFAREHEPKTSIMHRLASGKLGEPRSTEGEDGLVTKTLYEMAAAAVNGSKRTLEVACDDTKYLPIFGEHAIGLEIAKNSVSKAAKKNRLVWADGRQLPFKDQSFDAIVGIEFIEHILKQDAIAFIKEAARTLTDGGLLVLSTPDSIQVIGDHLESYNSVSIKEILGKLFTVKELKYVLWNNNTERKMFIVASQVQR